MAITPDGRIFAPIFIGQTTDDPEVVAAMAADPASQLHPEYLASHGGTWSDPFTGEPIGMVQDWTGVSHYSVAGPDGGMVRGGPPGRFNATGDIIQKGGLYPELRGWHPSDGTPPIDRNIGDATAEDFIAEATRIYNANVARAEAGGLGMYGADSQGTMAPPDVVAAEMQRIRDVTLEQAGFTGGEVLAGGSTDPVELAALARSYGTEGEMTSFEILARLIEITHQIGNDPSGGYFPGGEGALSRDEVEGWISHLQGPRAPGVGEWQAIDQIRSNVLQWRIGRENLSNYTGIAADSQDMDTLLSLGGDIAHWAATGEVINRHGPDEAGDVAGPGDEFGPGSLGYNDLISDISAAFPWASELGFMDLIESLVVEGAGAEQIVAEVRQSEMYNKMFPGMVGPGGTRRFGTEREYMTTVDNYRQVLRQHGRYDPGQDNPMDYVAFMDAGIDATELGDRFTTYEALDRGTTDLRNAFLVYADMQVSTDDLFQAVVSPEFRQELTNNYDRAAANLPFDYESYIARAAQAGKNKLVDLLEQMERTGAVTGAVVSRVLAMDDEFGRMLMGALFTGGGGVEAGTARTLSLEELTESFSAAVLGASAKEAGFGMPTNERIEEFRNAGITAAAARATYQDLAMRAPQLTGMLQRAGRGAELTRTPDVQGSATLAEQEVLGTTQELTFAKQAESARGRRAGGFQTGQQGRRFTQPGRSLGY